MAKRILALLLAVLLLATPAVGQSGDDAAGPEEYPEGVNPLTGLEVDAPDLLERRPILVKISNSPPLVRDYQSGLGAADQVWEILVEGGVTRFAAVFLAGEADHLGPVRSARLADLELVRYYAAMYANSGGATGTIRAIFNDPLVGSLAMVGGPCPPYCRFRQEGVAYEHTLYANTADLRAYGVGTRGIADEAVDVSGLAFSEAVPAAGSAASGFELRYRQTTVNWDYDTESGRWLRSQDGEAHIDHASGEQLSAANVVVLEALHIEQDPVSDGYWGTANYAFALDLVGEGRAVLFRDGVYYDGRWQRETAEDRMIFQDAAGNLLPFKPGNTWFQLVPWRWDRGYWLLIDAESPPVGTVTIDGLTLRDGPSTQFAVVDAAAAGTQIDLLGRNEAGTWVLGRLPGSTALFWASVEFVDLGGVALESLPLVVY